MRVLVTGSRDWESGCRVWEELDACLADAAVAQVELTVVHGDCPTGADRLARNWVQRRRTVAAFGGSLVREERYPADWNVFGKQAGFKRNADMVNLGADLCLAFIRHCTAARCRGKEPHLSHGASHTADLARAAGIETREWWEE